MKRSISIVISVILIFLTACTMNTPQPTIKEADTCTNPEMPFPLPEPNYNGKRIRGLGLFAVALSTLNAKRVAELDKLLVDATILDIQKAMAESELTSEELVTYYLARIQRYDVDKLNSVIELNPQVIEIAQQMDAEREAGMVRGDMYGIPVLLKGNIATGDGMHNRAGAYALKDWQPDRDAF